MKSHVTREFLQAFHALPDHIQRSTRRCYRLWRDNPQHPSLHFKRVGQQHPVYAVRVGIGWRALGVRQGEDII